jgi:hypothetical protein
MDQIYRGPLPGGGYVIACGRRRRVRCSYCADTDAQLECDGCDKPLCRACSVSPRDGLDFCPKCFDKAWKHWLQLQPTSAGAMTRAARRVGFRRWARAAADVFLGLVPLGAVARAAQAPEPRELWEQAGGRIAEDGTVTQADSEKYRALLVKHGHLVRKEK